MRREAVAAYQAGQALMARCDFNAAELAFIRADELGIPEAATCLGIIFESRGDTLRAERAYRRADQRGEPAAAHNLCNSLLGAMAVDGSTGLDRAHMNLTGI